MKTKAQTKAVLYTRVSSKKQVKEGNGLESQERMCRDYAKSNNILIVNQFCDGGVSGKFSSREGLDAMIAYVAKQNAKYTTIEYVLVDDIDRIIRDVAGWWMIKAKEPLK